MTMSTKCGGQSAHYRFAALHRFGNARRAGGGCRRGLRTLVALIGIAIPMSLTGCLAGNQGLVGRKLGEIRGAPPKRQEIDITVTRQALQEAANRTGENNQLRLIEVYYGAKEGTAIPNYRMFGIGPATLYYALGLRNNDVLVGANDYIVSDPNKFRQYAQLIVNSNKAQIEIIRAGAPTLVVITVTGSNGTEEVKND